MDLEKQQIERELFQKEVVRLSLLHPFLAIEAATGTGKGLSCMKIIEADSTPGKWLVLMPESLQIINFQDDVRKHNMEHIYDKIEDVICYASLHKFEGRELKLWCNETHRLSECRTDISKTIKYSRILVDSATINEDIKERLSLLGHFHYYKLSLKNAIEKGILPPPTIYAIGLELDDKIKRNTSLFGKKEVKLTDRAYVDKFATDLKYWSKRLEDNPKQLWIRNKFNSIGIARKNFFSALKTSKLKELLIELEGKRKVIFTGNIDQCNLVGGEYAVHSKRPKKKQEEILRQFNDKEIENIFFYKMGREGMNLEGIEAVVIVQLSTGNDEGLEFLQTSGRGYRGIAPEIYVLYIKGSKDKDFLDRALETIDKKYVIWK